MESLLSQSLAAADVQDGDRYKKHSRADKNDVEHLFLFRD
jgi:hypothetical protein